MSYRPISPVIKFPITHIELVSIGNSTSLLIYYPKSVVRNVLASSDFKALERNQIKDEAALPANLSCAQVALSKKTVDLALFVLGNYSAKNNQQTYLHIFEQWLNQISGKDFSVMRGNAKLYNTELANLLTKKILNEFETYCKNWWFDWRVGPSGDAQDIRVR